MYCIYCTVILSFLKRGRERDFANVSDRSPFLNVQSSWPFLRFPDLKTVENVEENVQERSWNIDLTIMQTVSNAMERLSRDAVTPLNE